MSDRLLDIEDLAKRLKIPEKTIRNKLCNETWPIRPLRIGKALRWRESDVEQALAELAAPTAPKERPPAFPHKTGAGAADQPKSRP